MIADSHRNILKFRVRFSSTLSEFRTQVYTETEVVRLKPPILPSARFMERPGYFAFQ